MRKNRFYLGVLAVLAMTLLLGAKTGDEGCGGGLDNRPGEKGIDVGGLSGAMWQVTYQDKMEVKVKKGAAIIATHNFAAATGGTFKVDGVDVDLTKFCGRDDVACPHELFPQQVKMTQPGYNLHFLYVTFNPVGPLKSLTEKTLVGNVDSDHDFSIALGIGAAAAGVCGLIGVSYATGHIQGNNDDPPIGTDLSGHIVTEYAGGCALLGAAGGAGAGLTVQVKVPFSAVRM